MKFLKTRLVLTVLAAVSAFGFASGSVGLNQTNAQVLSNVEGGNGNCVITDDCHDLFDKDGNVLQVARVSHSKNFSADGDENGQVSISFILDGTQEVAHTIFNGGNLKLNVYEIDNCGTKGNLLLTKYPEGMSKREKGIEASNYRLHKWEISFGKRYRCDFCSPVPGASPDVVATFDLQTDPPKKSDKLGDYKFEIKNENEKPFFNLRSGETNEIISDRIFFRLMNAGGKKTYADKDKFLVEVCSLSNVNNADGILNKHGELIVALCDAQGNVLYKKEAQGHKKKVETVVLSYPTKFCLEVGDLSKIENVKFFSKDDVELKKPIAYFNVYDPARQPNVDLCGEFKRITSEGSQEIVLF